MPDPIKIEDKQASQWAQEQTLKKLLSQAQISNDLLKIIASKDLTKEQIDNLKRLNKSAAGIGESSKATPKEISKLSTGLKQSLGRLDLSLFRSSIADLSKGLMTDSDSLISSMQRTTKQFGSSLWEAGRELGIFGKVIGGISGTILLATAGVLSLWTSVDDLNTQFRTMYDSGSRFETGLVGLAEAANQVGVTTGQISQIFTQFGTSVALLGTKKATELATRFTKLNRETGTLMMTNQEATEAVFSYMETFRGLTSIQSIDVERLSSQSRQYWQDLTALSEATGRQRKELNKSVESQVKNLDLNAALARYLPEQQDAVRKSIIQFQRFGPEVSDTFTKIMTSFLSGRGIAGLDKSLQLIVARVPGLYQGFEKLKEQMLKGEDVGPALAELASDLESPEFAKALSIFAGMGGEYAATAAQLQSLQQAARVARDAQARLDKEKSDLWEKSLRDANGDTIKAKEIFDKEMKTREKATTIFQNTRNALDSATSKIGAKFSILAVEILTPMLPLFEKFAKYVEELSDKYFPKVRETFRNFSTTLGIGFDENNWEPLKEQIKKTLGELFKFGSEQKEVVKKFFKDILPDDVYESLKSSYNNLTTIFDGIAGTFKWFKEHMDTIITVLEVAGTTIVGMWTFGKIKDLLNFTLPGKGAPTPGAPGGPAAGGSLIESVGTSLATVFGKGIEVILAGIAGGLTAFANPLVGEGAGIFALSLTGIGAAIAASGWMIGETLPTLTKGIRSLEEIDGTKLKSSSEGITSIADALASFAGSTFQAGSSGLSNWLESFVGADPMSKLKEIANFSYRMPSLNLVSEGLTQLSDAWKKIAESLKLELPTVKMDVLDSIVSFKDKVPDINSVTDALGKLAGVIERLSAGRIPKLKLSPEVTPEVPRIPELVEPSVITKPKVTPELPLTVTPIQIQNLLDRIQTIAKTTLPKAEEATPSNPAEIAGLVDPATVAQKTLQFYDQAKIDSKNMQDTLVLIKTTLDTLNGLIEDQTSTLSRSIRRSSQILT